MELCVEGKQWNYGCVYIPDEENQKKYFENLSEEEKRNQLQFNQVEVPNLLQDYREQLKRYIAYE